MEIIGLKDSVCSAYHSVNFSTIGIKSSIINCCAEISRFLRINFSIDISDKVDEEKFKEILTNYPKLSCLTLEQFNRYLVIIANIRNVNAHLHLKKKIFISKDLVEALTNILAPEYKIHNNGQLTVYGQAYLLNFLSNRYHIFAFLTSFYKNWFKPIANMKPIDRENFRADLQHKLQEYCGIGKPIHNTDKNKSINMFMNFFFRDYLTKIIFSIERESSNSDHTFYRTPSLSLIMYRNELLEPDSEEKDSLILLRNSWFHGIYLGEEIEHKDKMITMDFGTVIQMLSNIKKYLNRSNLEFKSSIEIINKFALSAFYFFAGRIVEVTYKLLDKRLLTEEKVEHRLSNSKNALKHIYDNIPYIEEVCALLGDDLLTLEVRGTKFTDVRTRKTKTEVLKIIKLHSDNGFKIGDYFTDEKDIVLALVNLNTEYQNKINEQFLSDYVLNIEESFGRISIYEATA